MALIAVVGASKPYFQRIRKRAGNFLVLEGVLVFQEPPTIKTHIFTYILLHGWWYSAVVRCGSADEL